MDKVLKRALIFADYTSAQYNKDHAEKIVRDFIDETNPKPEDQCAAYVWLGNLHSIWAKDDQRDLSKARRYYADAMTLMGPRLSRDLITARVNLPSLIPDLPSTCFASSLV